MMIHGLKKTKQNGKRGKEKSFRRQGLRRKDEHLLRQEPWKEENCWVCEGIGYEGWDNILPEYMPLSKELREMKDGDGPIEVVLTPVYKVKERNKE